MEHEHACWHRVHPEGVNVQRNALLPYLPGRVVVRQQAVLSHQLVHTPQQRVGGCALRLDTCVRHFTPVFTCTAYMSTLRAHSCSERGAGCRHGEPETGTGNRIRRQGVARRSEQAAARWL